MKGATIELLTSTALVFLYYLLPITGAPNTSAAIRLGVGLVVFGVLITWQIRAVMGSRYPGLRAVEALATAVPMFLLVFASTYLAMAHARPETFTQALTRTDALYFTVTVFATVGFGDIAPQTQAARVVVMFQMLGDLFVVGAVLQVMIGAVKAGLRRRAGAAVRRCGIGQLRLASAS